MNINAFYVDTNVKVVKPKESQQCVCGHMMKSVPTLSLAVKAVVCILNANWWCFGCLVFTHTSQKFRLFSHIVACCLLLAFDDLKDSIVSFVMEFMRDSA